MSASIGPLSPSPLGIPSEAPVGAQPLTRGEVLLVEDDPAILELVRRLLTAKGYAVRCADSGPGALEALGSHRFDLVVSDINLPGLTGIELLRRTRTVDPNLPVILVTAGPTVESAIEAVEHGALRYLQKPIDIKEMLEAVRRAVRIGRLSRLENHALALARSGDPALGSLATPGLAREFDQAFDQLWVAFQPIVRWSDHSVFAFEALARCRHPEFRSPPALFDAADRLSQVPRLSRRIREIASAAMTSAPDGAMLFLNLLGQDLLDEALFDEASPLAALADRVVLELTERESLSEIPGLSERVQKLRGMGFRIAIDDLGSGYAGLETFAAVEPDIVKLDMSLVRNIHRAPTKERLVRHLVAVAHELGAEVVGEGVETRDEREALVELGCDLLQGYYFARPAEPFPSPRMPLTLAPPPARHARVDAPPGAGGPCSLGDVRAAEDDARDPGAPAWTPFESGPVSRTG